MTKIDLIGVKAKEEVEVIYRESVRVAIKQRAHRENLDAALGMI